MKYKELNTVDPLFNVCEDLMDIDFNMKNFILFTDLVRELRSDFNREIEGDLIK